MIDYGYIVKIMGSLVLVILMMLVLLYLMKRFSYKGTVMHGSVRILSALNIGPRERIMLIQAGEEQILVGTTPGSIRALHVLKENLEAPAESAAQQPNMKTILASLMQSASKADKTSQTDTVEPKKPGAGV